MLCNSGGMLNADVRLECLCNIYMRYVYIEFIVVILCFISIALHDDTCGFYMYVLVNDVPLLSH